ncbi:MAG: hypothetical protein IT423_21630 [Pirellulaceae bacterium]|nr:hypothetical protein [Pirellulaceae bacterium]
MSAGFHALFDPTGPYDPLAPPKLQVFGMSIALAEPALCKLSISPPSALCRSEARLAATRRSPPPSVFYGLSAREQVSKAIKLRRADT